MHIHPVISTTLVIIALCGADPIYSVRQREADAYYVPRWILVFYAPEKDAYVIREWTLDFFHIPISGHV